MCLSDLSTADAALVPVSWSIRCRDSMAVAEASTVAARKQGTVMVRRCSQRFLQKNAAWKKRQLNIVYAESLHRGSTALKSFPTAQ